MALSLNINVKMPSNYESLFIVFSTAEWWKKFLNILISLSMLEGTRKK